MENQMKRELIAPCGMNCRLCVNYVREKKPCPGCRGADAQKPYHCTVCAIKNCAAVKNNPLGLCGEICEKRCRRLKDFDRRYREKYHMSPIENLDFIAQHGLDVFLEREKVRWRCINCGGVICAHKSECPECGASIVFKS